MKNRDLYRRTHLTQLLALIGALMAVGWLALTSPGPLMAVFLILTVPFITFALGAPSRLGTARDVKHLFRETEAIGLHWLLKGLGRREASARVWRKRQAMVWEHHEASGAGESGSVRQKVLLGNRIATAGALWVTLVGLAQPFESATLTYGPALFAPFIFLLDALLCWTVAKLVLGRVTVRLVEAMGRVKPSNTLDATLWLVWAPFFGGVLGAVGGLMMGQMLAVTSTMETLWLYPQLNPFQVLGESALTFAFIGFMPMAFAGTVVGAALSFGTIGQRDAL